MALNKFPDSFLFGTATASLQIEGGDKNNSWYDWSIKEGKIKDGSNSLRAADHWERVDEDINLMEELGLNSYRMSIEWARIEPLSGEFDLSAMNHYRDEIQKLIDKKIIPMVTLNHFSLPLWLEKIGGWTNPIAVGAFIEYTKYITKNIGDLVSLWCTINEPNIFSLMGYVLGEWPSGGQRGFRAYFTNASNMIKSHIGAYRAIHEIRREMGYKDTMVGVANHIVLFEPERNNFFDKLSCKVNDYFFHQIFLRGMCSGKPIFPFTKKFNIKKNESFADFFGVNYYTRNVVRFIFNPLRLFTDVFPRENVKKNDLGWEIYPEGLYKICKKYYEKYKIPIYITENGTADEKDEFRASFIESHLKELLRLISEGVDVRGYFHWTLTDNFEWAEGESARFGLIHLDYDTQKRTIRESGRLYSKIAKNKML